MSGIRFPVPRIWYLYCFSSFFLSLPISPSSLSIRFIHRVKPKLFNYFHSQHNTKCTRTEMDGSNELRRISPTNISKRRPMHLQPLQIGLTGSIGMGKSTVAQHFRDIGFPVFDADAAVHELYAQGGKAVEPIGKVYPDVIQNGSVSRDLLSRKIMNKEISLLSVESIVHPLVASARREFYNLKSAEGYFLVVFDIPLLFEKPSSHDDIDYIIVASASTQVQRERCLQRPGMTPEKLDVILSKQIPDEEKRKKADFVVNTDYKGISEAKAQVAKIVETIIAAHPSRWEAWKSRSVVVVTTSCMARDDNTHVFNLDRMAATLSQPFHSSMPSDMIDSIKENIKLVVFDLDDTLLEAYLPIKVANDALAQWMTVHMPLTAVDVKQKLRPTLTSIVNANPLVAHDLTRVRKEALYQLALVHNEESKVEEAMKIFITARSTVGPFLYEDVNPCLDWLSSLQIPIAIVTNGNANLSLCPTLGPKLLMSINAQDVGAMKPSPVPFIAISQRSGIPTNQILFIGDSFESDVKGSVNAGMISALIKRNNSIDSSNKFPQPVGIEYTLKPESKFFDGKFFELNSLIPDEIAPKLVDFIRNRKL